jgi:hypothetical protein
MQLFILESIVDGFGSGETDFATRLAADPIQASNFNTKIIDNIVDVLRSQPNAGAALSVVGHSDRDDTPGRSHIDHLAVERAASDARVTSAIAHIHVLVQQQEPSAPADLNSLFFFDVHLRSSGASVLIEDAPSLSEDQRRTNRRVQARLLVFKCPVPE